VDITGLEARTYVTMVSTILRQYCDLCL